MPNSGFNTLYVLPAAAHFEGRPGIPCRHPLQYLCAAYGVRIQPLGYMSTPRGRRDLFFYVHDDDIEPRFGVAWHFTIKPFSALIDARDNVVALYGVAFVKKYATRQQNRRIERQFAVAHVLERERVFPADDRILFS